MGLSYWTLKPMHRAVRMAWTPGFSISDRMVIGRSVRDSIARMKAPFVMDCYGIVYSQRLAVLGVVSRRNLVLERGPYEGPIYNSPSLPGSHRHDFAARSVDRRCSYRNTTGCTVNSGNQACFDWPSNGSRFDAITNSWISVTRSTFPARLSRKLPKWNTEQLTLGCGAGGHQKIRQPGAKVVGISAVTHSPCSPISPHLSLNTCTPHTKLTPRDP